MNPALEPIAVWDAREPAWRRNRQAKVDWLKEHGLPVNTMHRAEFYLIDAPCARIFCYALNEAGKRHWAPGHDPRQPHDHDRCGAAEEEPRMVPLDELPPLELR
jgi:hypothetical protein